MAKSGRAVRNGFQAAVRPSLLPGPLPLLLRLTNRQTRGWRLAFTVFGITTLACTPPNCTNEVRQTVPSPDGELKAVTFLRSCATPPGRAGHVSVLPAAGRRPTTAGNVARVVDTTVGSAGSREATREVSIEWSGARQLVVRYDARAVVVPREPPPVGLYVLFVPVYVAPTSLEN
jgi:hypothetical protein